MINTPTIANNVLVSEALGMFLKSLKPNSQRCYLGAFKKIVRIPELAFCFSQDMPLEHFTQFNFSMILDIIREKVGGAPATAQNRCAAFISFTRFLSRYSNGKISAAISNRGANPTFQQVREKSTAIAMTQEQCFHFLRCLKEQSYRDWMIARCILQGAKRISEVTSAKPDQIDWENNRITFVQKKSNILEKKTIITYPPEFMRELKEYLNERTVGPIFITRSGQSVSQPHLYRSFVDAGRRAGIPFRVHPHSLRATAITLLMKMGYHSDQIINVSGHASTKEVMYYDKTSLEENITRQFRLI